MAISVEQRFGFFANQIPLHRIHEETPAKVGLEVFPFNGILCFGSSSEDVASFQQYDMGDNPRLPMFAAIPLHYRMTIRADVQEVSGDQPIRVGEGVHRRRSAARTSSSGYPTILRPRR